MNEHQQIANDHSQHAANPPMEMMHHDHHKMMIDDFFRNYFYPLLIVFVITVTWTLYLWIKKMENGK